MHRKLAFLVCAIAGLMSVNQAFAQSSHDAATGVDADMPDTSSGIFEVGSPDGKFKLGFRGHLQENNKISYLPANDGKVAVRLYLNRARFSVYGNAFDPSLTYLFQTGFEKKDSAEQNGPPELNTKNNSWPVPGTDFLYDYYVNAACHKEYLQLRIGKFRTPFSRQQLMSTSQMQFYDPNAASDYFQITDSGRDVGIMAHNGFHNPFEWALAAVSNGLVARIGFNHNGIDGYEMADFTGGALRFAIAVNGFMHTDYTSAKLDDLRGGVDFIAKVNGFSTNGAFYYQRETKEKMAAENRMGGGLDLGYLINGKIEPVLRGSWMKRTEKGANETEGLLGLNYYLYGHHMKVQGYAGTKIDFGNEMKINKWLGGVQVQFAI